MAETHSTEQAQAVAQAKPAQKPKPRKLPPYNVILLDDDDHSYEYVVRMLQELFAFEPEKGFLLAEEVDRAGRAIVVTTHRELAELKCEQIHAYGADQMVASCAGSMTALIEPAMA